MITTSSLYAVSTEVFTGITATHRTEHFSRQVSGMKAPRLIHNTLLYLEIFAPMCVREGVLDKLPYQDDTLEKKTTCRIGVSHLLLS